MNRKNISFTLLIVLSLVAGCSPTTSIPPTKPAVTIEIPIIPTLTETPFSTPTPLNTPVVSQEISRSCVEINENNKLRGLLKGVLVFNDLSPDIVITISLHDLEAAGTRKITNSGPIISFGGISPDRKYLLYEYDSPSSDHYVLAVANILGEAVKEFSTQFPNDPYVAADSYSWQNAENIRVTLFLESQHASRMSPRIYNPFNGDYKPLKADFPGYHVGKDLDWGVDWFALRTMYYEGANIVYDPSLLRVLYPKAGERVSLTDVETNQELASIHLPHWGRLPKWSPDGNYLALVGTTKPGSSKASEDLYVVQRDGGEFRRLTYLSNTLEQSTIANYSWSPDGKHIAFWLYSEAGNPKAEGTQSELAIADTETGEVANLCVQGISARTHLNKYVFFHYIEPIWSPDGNQIMISQWKDPKSESRKFNVLVIDLPSLAGVKIDENKQPAGWMVREH